MVEINYLKVKSVIKKLFESTLFLAFVYMTVMALCDLFSFKTTLNISRELRNITILPAFSVCENRNIMVNLNIYLKAPFLSVLLDVAYARPHR